MYCEPDKTDSTEFTHNLFWAIVRCIINNHDFSWLERLSLERL
jgi:hypothetical protein